MRIQPKRDLKELALFSPQQLVRLEKAGDFRLRLKLGLNRVGWVESEVLNWLVDLDARRTLIGC